MLYLYDPRTNILTETTFKFVEEITGNKKSGLRSMKSSKKKLGKINCYLVDENTTLKQRKEWYIKEKYHMEVWKEIEGSDGKFLISSYGRVKRVYKNHSGFLLPYLHKKGGNLKIKVKFQGVYKAVKIGHLVAYHYLDKPKQGEVLHHKNGIVTDDYAGNLEYITKQKLGEKTGHKSHAKPVVQLDLETLEVLGEFRSAREAGRECYLSYNAVLENCNKKTKSSGGYLFMWSEEYEMVTDN